MNIRICPVCNTQFTPNSRNQKYDKWICKSKAERRRRRAREEPPPTNGFVEEGLFATLENPTPKDLFDLHVAYTVTKSKLPSRLIGTLPPNWGDNIHQGSIVPEYGTPNHMFLPQQ